MTPTNMLQGTIHIRLDTAMYDFDQLLETDFSESDYTTQSDSRNDNQTHLSPQAY